MTDIYKKEKYFKVAEEFYENNAYKLFKQFFLSMMPRRGEIEDSLIQKMKQLKPTTLAKTSHEKPFAELVEQGVELMER